MPFQRTQLNFSAASLLIFYLKQEIVGFGLGWFPKSGGLIFWYLLPKALPFFLSTEWSFYFFNWVWFILISAKHSL